MSTYNVALGYAAISRRIAESAVAGLAVGNAVLFDTKDAMDADLAHVADTLAIVVNDSTAANNGIYRKLGDSGAGSWSHTDMAILKATASGRALMAAIDAAAQRSVLEAAAATDLDADYALAMERDAFLFTVETEDEDVRPLSISMDGGVITGRRVSTGEAILARSIDSEIVVLADDYNRAMEYDAFRFSVEANDADIVPYMISSDGGIKTGRRLSTGALIADVEEASASNSEAGLLYVTAPDASTIYITQPPTGPGRKRIQYEMKRTTVPSRNQDAWKINGAWEVSGSGGTFTQGVRVGSTGEWETAIKEAGRVNFMGNNHGNEEATWVYLLVDGDKRDPGAFTTTCRSFEIVQQSEFFQIGATDETEYDPKGPKMLDCTKRWQFIGNDVFLHVVVDVVTTFNTGSVYLGMAPFSLLQDDVLVTTTVARSPLFEEEDASYVGHPNLPATTSRVVKLWGEAGIGFEVEALEGFTHDERQCFVTETLSRNKVYFNFRNNTTLTAGDRIEAVLRYTITTTNEDI